MTITGFEVSTYIWIILLTLLVDAVKIYVEIWNRPVRRNFRTDLDKVTALIPTRNGSRVIEGTVADLLRAGLSRDNILVIDDGSTDGTTETLKAMEIPFFRVPHMGKVSAINFGIYRVKTPYVLLLDDDTRIGNAAIPTSLLETYDAVAFNVIPDRRDRHGPKGSSLVSCLQRYEYCKSMEIGKRFQDGTASISCISGAIGLFKKENLQAYHHEHSGAFQGEDLQRTIIELMNNGNVVFVDEAVWTVVPDEMQQLLGQRLINWYPAHYHMFSSYLKLLFRKGTAWRLRYEMAYNTFVVVSEPFRLWSLIMIGMLQLWDVLAVVYLLYLVLEMVPFVIIQKKLNSGSKYMVLALYPLYGLSNVLLRVCASFVWAYKVFVTGEMRRKTEKDRRWNYPAEA